MNYVMLPKSAKGPADSLTASHCCHCCTPIDSFICCCSAAQVANASGVLFSPLPGRDVEQMACNGAECDLPLAIWASMVPRSTATAIAEVRYVSALRSTL